MKRIIAIIAVLMMCCAMFVPVAAAENEFTPSVTNKPAPEVVPVPDGDGEPAIGILYDDDGQIIGYVYEDCLVITPVSDANTSTEIPDASRETLLDVYNKLINGEMTLPYELVDPKLNPGNMVIRDLFDATFVCGDHPELLAQDGVTMKLTFDLNVKPGVDVVAMTYIDGKWVPVESIVNNGDGTVTCGFEEICPIAFAVKTAEEPPVQTGDDSGKDLALWGCIAAVALVGIVVLTVVGVRSGKKAD